MKILNRAQFNSHMDPRNNYLAGKGLGEKSEPPKVINIEEENSTPDETPESNTEVLSGPILINEPKLRIGQRGENIPDFLRVTVAQLANEPGVRQKDIAEAFDIGQSVVSKAKNGIVTYGNGKDEKLTQVVNDKKKEIKDQALDKVLHTLGLLTLDDIELLGAKDKADVAVKLAKVADSVTEKSIGNAANVQFVIMTPQVREKVHYEELEV